MRVQILDGRYTRWNPRLQDGVLRVVFPAARHRAVVLAILRNGLFIALRLYISSRWVVAEKSIQKI